MFKGLLDRVLDSQYRRPTGAIGRFIGSRMIEQHTPENDFTLGLLDAQPTDHILELGFGSGYAIGRLAAIVTQGLIAGVDISQTMVEEATKFNADAISAGYVDLRKADAAQLPFADCTFDKAFSIHSVYFWSEPLRALGEVLRVLKPGGLFVVTLLPRTEASQARTCEFRPYAGTELSAMLHVGGFREMTIRDERTPDYKSNYAVIGYKPVT